MVDKSNEAGTWEAFRRGEDGAFQCLYREHYVGLFNYCAKVSGSREMANEMVIETLLALWDKRDKLPQVNKVRSYLLTCVHFTILQHYRSEKRRETVQSISENFTDSVFDYEDYFIRLETKEQFKKQFFKAFNNLTARQKELLELRYYLDLSYDEIAERCGITKRTAYNIVFGALDVLKKEFEGTDTQGIDPHFLIFSLLFLTFSLLN